MSKNYEGNITIDQLLDMDEDEMNFISNGDTDYYMDEILEMSEEDIDEAFNE